MLTACQVARYSPKFEKAFAQTLIHEGGYVNDPADYGGETKYGISKKAHPDVNIKNLTLENAKDIYYREYWQAMGFENIYDDELAAKMFDIRVNFRHQTFEELMRRALASVQCNPNMLNSNMSWGRDMLWLINRADPKELRVALRSEQAGTYRLNVTKDATQARFINGWLKRAYKQ
jgi:lysozyme family protein